MISTLALDLRDKIKAIASGKLGSPARVGLAVGATTIDPSMERVVLPAVWVVYVGNVSNNATNQGMCGEMVTNQFVVKVFVKYDSEKDMLDNQWPLLDEIAQTVNGSVGPVGSMRWKFEGQQLDELSGNRAVYDQRFSIVASI